MECYGSLNNPVRKLDKCRDGQLLRRYKNRMAPLRINKLVQKRKAINDIVIHDSCKAESMSDLTRNIYYRPAYIYITNIKHRYHDSYPPRRHDNRRRTLRSCRRR